MSRKKAGRKHHALGRKHHAPLRTFKKGSVRDTDAGKVDYEGHLSPLVLCWYGEYCDKQRRLPSGSLRASDNWQLGIPLDSYMKSALRHFLAWWLGHREHKSRSETLAALGALIFNAQGYAHELLKQKGKK